MKMITAIRLLQLLGSRPDTALSVVEIARKWREMGGTDVHLRSIQRYVSDLSLDGPEGPALLQQVGDGHERRFYLRASQVANWFMTEEAALNLQLTHQVLGRTFGSLGGSNGDKLVDMADRIANASTETRRMRDRLRIAPDGIGRLPARIAPEVLKASIAAISKGKKLTIKYVNSAGNESTQIVSPLGLVAKDGTIYLVAIKGLGDTPRHFALQRMAHADIHFQAAQPRPDFDLDRYIHDTHQFSHPLDAQELPVTLKLRVAPQALFHFRERALSPDQSISPANKADGSHLVTAKVPDTVLLTPFLVSMGPWIEVLGPDVVRAKVAEWLRQSAAHYAPA
jgi:predicted DNA-binding transcriptional regulator YafY